MTVSTRFKRPCRIWEYAFAELQERATRRVAANFLRRLIELLPYKIHTVLTDNGTHFTSPGDKCSAAKELEEMMERVELFRAHAFEYACAQNDIDHRLTRPNHPWTSGQVERMDRTIIEATVCRYHYENHDRLRAHLRTFLDAYNVARRLNALKGLTPFEAIRKASTEQPKRFKANLTHHNVGLNSYGSVTWPG